MGEVGRHGLTSVRIGCRPNPVKRPKPCRNKFLRPKTDPIPTFCCQCCSNITPAPDDALSCPLRLDSHCVPIAGLSSFESMARNPAEWV
ncbi:hypothetical protein K469DRAFT_158993 [Zopfia rhizophila CBS 207.26]|uniref:Uncharacterized protein n=1 Tax=Zopfia rhizophila CBS 207.26 TaxID=1314779 RepID=A0A6A6E5A6_9PEZI|nr:hypothetical protein K469DRAFT_158993 [Zopfia rhizophila CBS 207.26]